MFLQTESVDCTPCAALEYCSEIFVLSIGNGGLNALAKNRNPYRYTGLQ